MRPWNPTIVIVRSILLAIVLMTTPIPAAEKQTGDASVALPEIVFPGHANIGADLNAYKQPKGTWEVVDVRADRYDRLYYPGDPVRLRITLRNASAKPQVLAGAWRWRGSATARRMSAAASRTSTPMNRRQTWTRVTCRPAAKSSSK